MTTASIKGITVASNKRDTRWKRLPLLEDRTISKKLPYTRPTEVQHRIAVGVNPGRIVKTSNTMPNRIRVDRIDQSSRYM